MHNYPPGCTGPPENPEAERIAEFCMDVAAEIENRLIAASDKFFQIGVPDTTADPADDTTELLDIDFGFFTVRTSGQSVPDHVDDFFCEAASVFESCRNQKGATA